MKLKALTDKKFLSRVVAIGLPVALQNLLVNSSTMVDTMMVGSLGEEAVAAVGLVSQFVALYVAAFFGFTGGGIMFFSQFYGAQDEDGMCKAYGLTTTCMVIVGLLFGGAAIFAPEFVLGVYTDKGNLIEAGIPYLRVVGISLPIQSVSIAISSLLRSTERVKAPLIASIISQATNFVINGILIFGLFGFPQIGITGAAIGTLVSSILNVIVLYVYCMKEGNSPILKFSRQFKWNLAFLKLYFLKSLPIIINEAMVGIVALIVNVVMGRQPAGAIAAMAVFRAIERLIFSFFSGFTNASAVIVGKQIGAGEHEGGYRDAKRFAVLCPIVTCFICIVIFAVRGPLLGLFGLSGLSREYAEYMLGFYILAGTLRTCNYIVNDTFRAAGETVFGTAMEVACQFIFTVPAVCLAGLYFALPFQVVFSLIFIDDILRIWVMLGWLKSGRWIKPVTDEGRAALPAFKELLHKRKALKKA